MIRRVALVAALAAVPRIARADYGPEAVELDRDDPPAGRVELGFDSGAPLAEGAPGGWLGWGASLELGLLRRPLVIQTNPGTRVPVSRRETLALGGALAIGERVVLDARLPLAHQSGARLIATGLDDDRPLARDVLGDLQIAVRGRVVGSARRAMFVRAFLTLPTGDEANFAGEPNPGGGLALIGRFSLEDVVFAATAGLHLRRDEVVLGDRVIGNELTYAAGVRVPIAFGIAGTVEADGAVGDRQGKMRGPAPLELRAGVYGPAFGGLVIGVRAGIGVIDEIGAPAWRASLTLAWQGERRFAHAPHLGIGEADDDD